MNRPTDIPEDVWEAAVDAVTSWYSLLLSYNMGDMPSANTLVFAVARAIQEERERAAKVCEDAADDADDRLNRMGSDVSRRNYASAHVTCKRLATAIRIGK